MKSITEYFINESKSIKHRKSNGTGEFYTENGYLIYYTDNTLYGKNVDFELATLLAHNKLNGTGAELMNEFIKFVGDKSVILLPEPIGNSITKADLVKFYEKFGFIKEGEYMYLNK